MRKGAFIAGCMLFAFTARALSAGSQAEKGGGDAALSPEAPPASGWVFNDRVELNGRSFDTHEFAESYREQEGYALVQGKRRHYWLYDTYSYHGGDGDELMDRVIPSWVEDMGYVIDFDNIQYPDADVASSVKALMRQRSCDMAVALVTGAKGGDFVLIDSYDAVNDAYWSVRYPLYK